MLDLRGHHGHRLNDESLASRINACACAEHVKEIYAQGNMIRAVPDLSRFIRLQQVFLWDCAIEKLPRCFFVGMPFCENLTHLDVDTNQIDHIPREISRCPNLIVLMLSNNLLTHVPSSIAGLSRLERLYLSGNPDLQPATLQKNAASRNSVQKLQEIIRHNYFGVDRCRDACYALIVSFVCLFVLAWRAVVWLTVFAQACRMFRGRETPLFELHLNTFIDIAIFLFSTRFEHVWCGDE